jgi:hypothetical protein
MADSVKFKRMEGTLYLESEFFDLTKEEVIKIFKSHPIDGLNVFKKIENHQAIVVAHRSNDNIKYLYHPQKDSEDYVFHMWKPEKVEGFFYQKMLEFMRRKEAKNLNENNENPWIEEWLLKP